MLRSELGLPAERFTEVLDYFHAVERIGAIADRTVEGNAEVKQAWTNVLKRMLKAGDIESIERSVTCCADDPGVATDLAFLDAQRERMRYGTFRQSGTPVGSGAVQSAVRRVVNLRMKGTSVFWTEEHAEGMLHLRAHAKSGRWDDLETSVHGQTCWSPTSRIVRAA